MFSIFQYQHIFIIDVVFLLKLIHYFLNYELDPCDTITCNGTNAQCQVYLGGENKGKPFCVCPQGFTGDPKHNCGKHVWLNDMLQWCYFLATFMLCVSKK